jgi:ABC-2 type transport system permease protein
VPLPANFAGFVVAFLLAALGVFAIGLFIAALAPTGKAANSIGTLLFFPSMFFAGLWTPREVFPHVLQRIGDFTPLGAGEVALHSAATGHWPSLLSATVLVGYLAVFGLGAARLFRWS